MSQEVIAHDAAWASATSIIEMLEPIFRDGGEAYDAFGEIYNRIKAAIEFAFAERLAEIRRLQPLN
jgi:hypothetical protein